MQAPRVDEQAAADGISAVVKLVEPPEFEPNGRDTAPDWRITMTCGRVADVEVIRSTDEDATWFMQSLAPDGSPRVKPDARLSHEWTILVSDQSPATNRGLGLRNLMDAVCNTLASVESEHYSPEQMKEIARWELRLNADAGLYFGGSRYIYVLKEPHHVGDGHGSVSTHGSASHGGGAIHSERLIPPIQECIDHKASDAQLDDAPDLKWLAVMPEGEPAWLLMDFFGPNAPSPPPRLDAISFDYFDEVWVAVRTFLGEDRKEGFVVLRLSEHGDTQQRYVVPRRAVSSGLTPTGRLPRMGWPSTPAVLDPSHSRQAAGACRGSSGRSLWGG